MSKRYLPEVLFENGFTDLISVVPPNATISPGSKLVPSTLGKVPGRRNRNGTWAGYNWRKAEHTVDDVRGWMTDGANVGIKAGSFPGVDIDCLDEPLAAFIEKYTLDHLGWAPVRFGRRPKRLLMYQTPEPFGRIRLHAVKGGEKHLVEFLGAGQQYLVHGTHPSGANYEWTCEMREVLADSLTPITKAQVFLFRDGLRNELEARGCECYFEGEGTTESNISIEQASLLAPSLEAIHDVFEIMPNDGEFDRDQWVKIGYAAKAAGGEENEHEVSAIFSAWSATWCGSVNNPQGTTEAQAAEEFRRFVPPYRIGWPYLAEEARAFGYSNAGDDFEALEQAPEIPEPPEPEPEDETRATRYTDFWLSEEVIAKHADRIRYVSENGQWYVWTGKYWEMDLRGKVFQLIREELQRIGKNVIVTSKETAITSKAIQSQSAKVKVESLMRHAPDVAIGLTSFDADPWIINTPDGVIDLHTGSRLTPDPARLCSKQTRVAPDFGGPCPEWRRFLAEATGGDRELESYLQRIAGYYLTGTTLEQQFTIFHGKGGNGKGTFKNAIEEILGDYANTADMATFTEQTGYSRHSTDVASLAGSRLVTASETNKAQKLDGARLRQFSGQDRIKARFMRQDDFIYVPQFKLLFLMNHPPVLQDASEAMRRRLHLVPFTVQPKLKDELLGDKLRQEYPAIFAWMIEGCLAWQEFGLAAPLAVTSFTEEYFENEDFMGRWIKDRLEAGGTEEGGLRIEALWNDYNDWANLRGLPTFKRSHIFAKEIRSCKLRLGKNAQNQSVVKGMVLKPMDTSSMDLEALP